MLIGINKLLTGDILKALCDMGHGDALVIADANFPAESIARCTGRLLIRVPDASASDVLNALIGLFPVDFKYTEYPAIVMERTKEDADKPVPEAWGEFEAAIKTQTADAKLTPIERYAFYERAKGAFQVIQTGEARQYGNLILTKGVVL